MKKIIILMLAIMISRVAFCQNGNNSSSVYIDSTIYIIASVEMNGKLYSFTDKTSKDYSPKFILYFYPNDSLKTFSVTSINFQKGFILVPTIKFEFLMSKLGKQNPITLELNKDKKLNKESTIFTDTKNIKAGKVNEINLHSRFFIFFLDVNIYKSLFWTPKKNNLPKSGYIKLITPAYIDSYLN
ncbi:hypothetical protein [Ferruginibacter profundus]